MNSSESTGRGHYYGIKVQLQSPCLFRNQVITLKLLKNLHLTFAKRPDTSNLVQTKAVT